MPLSEIYTSAVNQALTGYGAVEVKCAPVLHNGALYAIPMLWELRWLRLRLSSWRRRNRRVALRGVLYDRLVIILASPEMTYWDSPGDSYTLEFRGGYFSKYQGPTCTAGLGSFGLGLWLQAIIVEEETY